MHSERWWCRLPSQCTPRVILGWNVRLAYFFAGDYLRDTGPHRDADFGYPDFADSHRKTTIFGGFDRAKPALYREPPGRNPPKVPVVQTQPIATRGFPATMPRHRVSTLHKTPQGWPGIPLLECRREQAVRPCAHRPAARALPCISHTPSMASAQFSVLSSQFCLRPRLGTDTSSPLRL